MQERVYRKHKSLQFLQVKRDANIFLHECSCVISLINIWVSWQYKLCFPKPIQNPEFDFQMLEGVVTSKICGHVFFCNSMSLNSHLFRWSSSSSVIMKIKVSCYPVFPSCSTQPFVCWTIPSLWSISKDLPFRNPIAANSFCQQIISVIIICSQKYQSLAALSNCYNLVQLFKNTKSGSMYMGGMPDSIFLVLLCCWAAYLKCKSS